MATTVESTRFMAGPSYADSIHDGRWEFIQPPVSLGADLMIK